MRATVPGRGRSLTLLSAVVTVLALLLPSVVLAHAELDTITPANGSTVDVAPTQIVATFTEALDPAKSSIVVLNAGGAQVATGGTVAADDTKRMTLALPALEPGAYQVRWTSTSAQDGDIDRGTTGFTYAPAATPSPTTNAAASATPAPSVAATPSAVASPSVAPSPTGGDTSATTTSASDFIIPIVVAVVLVAGLGYWLLRGRSRTSGTP